jgi:hypothetical protein
VSFGTYVVAFVDGYGVVPAAPLNQWRTDIALALDGCAGGSYAPGAPINIGGAGFGTIDVRTLSEVAVGGQRVFPVGATITDVDLQTVTLAQGQFREFATPTAQRDHYISETGAVPGSWIHLTRPATGNFPIILHRPAEAGAIVTLPNLTWSSATVYFDSSGLWRLLDTSAGTPGAHA